MKNDKNKYRVLHVMYDVDMGGVEKLITEYYKYIDKEQFHFDIVAQISSRQKKTPTEGYCEKLLRDMGASVYFVAARDRNYFENRKDFIEILTKNKYDIVHAHLNISSITYLHLAQKMGVPVCIAHAHSISPAPNIAKALVYGLLQIQAKKDNICYFSCSEKAALKCWGETIVNSGQNFIIKNAVELAKFEFNKDTRDRLRCELGLEKNIVVGNVGRLTFEKNQSFLVEIAAELVILDEMVRLLFVGDGGLKNELIDKARRCGVADEVIFLGQRSDVEELFNVFDVYCMPSFFEGFPVSSIEAQANGLPCVFSEAITSETKILKTSQYVGLDKSAKQWAEIIYEATKCKRDENARRDILESGYSIETAAQILQNKYCELIEKTKLGR